MNKVQTLRFILGDQLNRCISSLEGVDLKNDVIFMCEVLEETQYVKHHKKKIALIFSAMRHFARELQEEGFQVDYIRLDSPGNSGSFSSELERAIKRHQPSSIKVTMPGEYRVLQLLQSTLKSSGANFSIEEDSRFLTTPDFFKHWAQGRKEWRMEYFYREVRKKHHILMEANAPVGGKWNYDAQNRNSLPEEIRIPAATRFEPDELTQEVLDLVAARFADHFGELEPFSMAATRQQALKVLDEFIKNRLSSFGDYQDAMRQGEPWLFHSHISFYLNCGLLLPMEVVRAAEEAYYQAQAPLHCVEGFIRQIVGWREYVMGFYWMVMPDYSTQNFFQAKRSLPGLYWTANTKMNCMAQCVKETQQNAYAHHIQRLMVLGNFALLAGISPKEVNEWYLLVYADAYEWVELPNVSGMVLFADGGVLASKPYIAGGNYIRKMSNYCDSCRYDVNKKNGEQACPFNYLYWNFLSQHEQKLSNNPRLRMPYASLRKMSDDKRKLIATDASRFFKALESGEVV